MSQSDVIARRRRTRIGIETTFGTTPSGSFPNAMTDCLALGDDLTTEGLTEEMLPVMDERSSRLAAQAPAHGLRIASKLSPLKFYLKAVPSASFLIAAATPLGFVHRIAFLHALGNEFAGPGTTISGTTSTVSLLRVADSSLLKKGSFIAVQVGTEMEWTEVVGVDATTTPDEVNISPPLSAAPATDGHIVRNLYGYCPAESHSSSLAVDQAMVGDSAAQVTANGCYGDLSLAFEIGKLATLSLGLNVTDFTGPSAQSLSTAQATDNMSAPVKWAPKVYFAPAVADLTLGDAFDRATWLKVEGMGVEYTNGWEQVRDPGSNQTVSHVVNMGGGPAAVAKGMLKVRFDAAYPAAFRADTRYRYVIVQKIGTGLTASFIIASIPNAQIISQPKPVKVGERLLFDLALEGYQDTAIPLAGTPETGADLERIQAPIRIAMG